MSRTASRMLLLAAAFLFSTGGAAIKSTAMTSWQVAGFRSAVASVALMVLVPPARRGWSRQVWAPAAAYCTTMVLFVMATKMTTAANAIFLQSTAPLYMLVLGPWLLGEKLRRADLLFAAPVAAGMAMVFTAAEPAAATAPDPARGNVSAALSGVAWALTIAGLRRQAKGVNDGEATPMAVVAAGNILAFAVCLPMAVPVTAVGPRDVLALLYLGVFQIGLAYVCLTQAFRRVPAFEASTLLLAEPAMNPLWTWLLHRERPSAGALAGGAVILATTLASAWWHGRRGRAD